MSFNLSEHFSKRFDPFTAQLCKITKIEADQWPDGTVYIAFTFTSEKHPGTRHVEKISCIDDRMWLFARLYYAAGHDLVGKKFILKRIDDPKEHSQHLLNRVVYCGFDTNKKGYVQIAEMVRKDDSLDAWLSAHVAQRIAEPTPETEAEQSAELDAVFGGAPEQPRVSSENQIPDEVLPF